MKKLLLLFAAVGMIFTACQSGGDVEEDNGGTPFVPEITISPKDLTFSCNGGEQEVAITTNFEYEVAERASWLTVEQTDEGLLVVVDANKNTSERSAFISITNSQYDINKSIEVWQEGYVPKIELSQQTFDVGYEAATYSVSVTSPYYWKAVSDNDWIEVETATGIAGTKELKFSVSHNKVIEPREGTIVIKNSDYNLIAELYVIQKGVSAESKNVMLYTSSNGKIVEPYNSDRFGANIVSNTYHNGQGIIIFDAPVTSIGSSAFRDCTSLTSVTIGNSVTSIGDYAFENCTSLTSVTIGNSVTSIGSSAFDNCRSLTSVTIPDSVTSIKAYAFYDCTSLTSITIGNRVTSIGSSAFRDCTSLTSVTIPDSVTSIGDYAFYECDSLTSVTIGNSVTSIGWHAFYNCRSLTSVTIGNSVKSIGNSAFQDCTSLTSVTIPDSVISIGDSAFGGCTSLKSVTIPDSVTSIGSSAFRDCTSLTSVTIGNSVKSIGNYAFSDCTSLTSVTIPDSVTSIGGSAFYECSSLTSVTIPDSVISIGDSAFCSCTSLTSVTIGNSVTSIGDRAFYECSSLTRVDITDLSAWCKISFGYDSTNPLYYGAKLYLNGSELTDITIPSDITEIKDYAFSGCTSLTSVTIGNSVTSIGMWAFSRCTSLTSITIPDSVTSIGHYAFYGCTSLTSVTTPDSVTSIGDYAFGHCTSLEEVYCKPTTPPAGGRSMFNNNASGRKIYVPKASVNAYKAASGWRSYASYIERHDF